jgi:hypothetical protein
MNAHFRKIIARDAQQWLDRILFALDTGGWLIIGMQDNIILPRSLHLADQIINILAPRSLGLVSQKNNIIHPAP